MSKVPTRHCGSGLERGQSSSNRRRQIVHFHRRKTAVHREDQQGGLASYLVGEGRRRNKIIIENELSRIRDGVSLVETEKLLEPEDLRD